jgi:urease accessory protein
MYSAEAVHLQTWHAELELGFERRGERTVLASRRQDGPLAVQKPLYPEGDGVCHAIVLHPPGGIAGGDELEIAVRASDHAHALLTTPGAAKWYRTAGPWASQSLTIEAGEGARVEWLPQETIVFDGALASMKTEVRLAAGACYLGWEILCLGRSGSGEHFARGACRLEASLQRDERLLRIERGTIDGGSPLLESAAGLAGQTVCGTLLAAAGELQALLAPCRELKPESGAGAVTLLPGVLVARYLGASSEAAKCYFTQLWRLLRPAVAGIEAREPRIWST